MIINFVRHVFITTAHSGTKDVWQDFPAQHATQKSNHVVIQEN